MKLEIQHGIFTSYTGSAVLTSNNHIATTTIYGPSDNILKDEICDTLSFEVKVRHSSNARPFESFMSGIISRILEQYIDREADRYRSFVVNVYTNAFNLSLICNSVLVACLDAGIPLKSMFYCTGVDTLLVFSGNSIDLWHAHGPVDDNMRKTAMKDLEYIKESIKYGIKDMFSL